MALNFQIFLDVSLLQKLSKASSLESIMSKKSSRGAVAIVVNAINPYAVKRVNLTFREDILDKIDRFAKFHGLTRSNFLAIAAINELEKAKAI